MDTGQPTAAMTEAVELVARTEGILLDPVYRPVRPWQAFCRWSGTMPSLPVKLSSSGTLAVHLVSSRIQRCFIDKFQRLLVGRLQESRPSTRFGSREPQPLGNEDFDRARGVATAGTAFLILQETGRARRTRSYPPREIDGRLRTCATSPLVFFQPCVPCVMTVGRSHHTTSATYENWAPDLGKALPGIVLTTSLEGRRLIPI